MDEGASGPVPGRGDPGASGSRSLGQLDSTLDHLERLCVRLEQAERNLKRMTDECGDVLQSLVVVDRRHSAAVADLNQRLSNWCDIERKLLEESARRIERFERGVGREWTVLRRLHEEPIESMRAQAEDLRRACLEAARLAQQRLDTVEEAYAARAAALEQRMTEWSQQIVVAARNAVASAGPTGAAAPGDSAAPAIEPWPLEGVAQLHQEMRAGLTQSRAASADGDARSTGVRIIEADAASAGGGEEARPRRRILAGAFVGAVAVLVGFGAYWSGLRGSAAGTVPLPAPVAPQSASDEESRREAEARLREVKQAADRAMTIVDILAAPDLRRFPLRGLEPAPGASAQLLWSGSRGVAVTAMRLPQPAPGKLYQVWLASRGASISLGPLEVDAEGRATLTIPGTVSLPRPGTVRVTLEDKPGVQSPTGPTILSWVPET
ncbi:MAG: anti-sigma factor domain-containing protein [Vicinamibacterales bacterium]